MPLSELSAAEAKMKVLGKSRDAYLLESSDRRARSVLVAYRDGRPLCSFQLLMAATVVVS